MKKILCLCDHGRNRSVVMASVLRERGHFAVAGSYDNTSRLLGNQYAKTLTGTYFIAIKDFFDEVIQMQEGGKHFIGRDELEVSDEEWEVRCKALADRLGF